MENAVDWPKVIKRMEELMRLQTFPIAIKMLERKEDLEAISRLRRMKHKVQMCQLFTLARVFKWTVGATLDDFHFPMCPSVIGLTDTPDLYKDGTLRMKAGWVATKEDGKKFEESVPRLPLGKYEAIAVATVANYAFEPDVILIYGNPAQIQLLINAIQFEKYEALEFSTVGESCCSDTIVKPMMTGKPMMTLCCYGERRYANAQDSECVMGMPPEQMEKALRGLESLYKRGVRYPIAFAGAELDLAPVFPGAKKGGGKSVLDD